MTPIFRSAASAQNHVAGLEFKSVRKDPERMEIVRKVFERLYKDPERALAKITEGEDRTCRLLYQGTSPKGLIVYKNTPDSDCRRYGSDKSLEIKVLTLLDSQHNEHKGLTTQLLAHVLQVAASLCARAVHVKLGAHETDLVQFYTSHGFTTIKEHVRPDSKTVEECVLQKRLFQPDHPPITTTEPRMAIGTPKAPPSSGHSVGHPLTRGDYKDVTLKNPYVQWIKQGTKTIEGRIHAGLFRNVKEGDRFRFFNPSAEVFCRVVSVKKYDSFATLLAAEGYKKCIPGSRSFEEAADIYNKIPGYTERARESGVSSSPPGHRAHTRHSPPDTGACKPQKTKRGRREFSTACQTLTN